MECLLAQLTTYCRILTISPDSLNLFQGMTGGFGLDMQGLCDHISVFNSHINKINTEGVLG